MLSRQVEFERLIQENKGIIFKICHSFCHNSDDRDDLAQEILFNLWKAFSSFTPNFKFSTWMYRISMNVAISYYRKEKRAIQFVPVSSDLFVLEKEEENHDTEENLIMLYGFIHALQEMDKAIMILYMDEKSHQEIADITGISLSNVGTKINRIKEKLKTHFFHAKKTNHGN